MPQVLPLFPLDAVLFPDMLLPLHIFEPRYRLLIRRSLEQARPFGIVLMHSGPDVGGTAEPRRVGTEARIVAHAPLPDGRSYVVARGERRFAIEALQADLEPYLVGTVGFLSEEDGPHAADHATAALDAFGEYLLAVLAVTADDSAERAMIDDLRGLSPRKVAYRIAAGLAVDQTERQQLLELGTASERLAEETRLLRRETALLRDLLTRLRARGERGDLN